MARKRREEEPIEIAVPITPMLDMSFQLLSFFIITFKPAATEGQLAINLPKLDAGDSAMVDPSIPDVNKDEYTITVHAGLGGEVALLGLKGPTVNSENIKTFSDLLDQLKQVRKTGGVSDKISITIEATNDLNYSRLIEIMDLCKKAGFDTVNLMPMRKENG